MQELIFRIIPEAFLYNDGTTTDHAVVLVGWVTDAALANGGYWILRNSWNTDWGESVIED